MEIKSDIQIAQEAHLENIKDVAAKVGVTEDELEMYGKYKAKLSDELIHRVENNEDGKLVLITAINPTPAGEGKTTISLGLTEALNQKGISAIAALREPSLGPCFGIKGGAAGGGYAQAVPMEDLNLHFTGDFHAITSANNLLAAMLDNHIHQGNALGIDTKRIVWKRCMDMNDRTLRNIVIGLGDKPNGVTREDHFIITVASEIMAILCLAEDMKDLKERIDKIIVAYNYAGDPVTAKDLKATGAMAALLKDAIKPNMIQTLENTPVLVHGGPFANIAHGCNSVRATKLAASFILLFIIHTHNVWVWVGLIIVATIGTSMFNMVIWAMITDVIDESEVQTGVRQDGTIYSVYSFARKLGQACSSGLSGVLLSIIGYTSATAFDTKVVDGIYNITCLVPAGGMILLLLALWFLYPLNKKRVEENAEKLRIKRNENA